MPYVERVTKAGNTIEIERYFTSRYKKKGISRGDKVKPTKEEQEKVNTRQAERKLRILINANYGYGDYHLVLDYIRRKGEPDRTPEQMRQDIDVFLRECRKEYRKAGLEFKYIHVMEIGKKGARHHHLVVNKIDTEILQRCWYKAYEGHNRVKVFPLDDSGNYAELASYLIKYTGTHKKGTDGALQGKRWNCSKNLVRPEPEYRIISDREYFKKEPKAIKDCNVKTGTCQKCDQYINKAEAEKTDEQRYSEEQDAIDRQTKKKLQERADTEKMEHLPSEGNIEHKQHELKIVASYYEDVISGKKSFELRKNDRGYKQGDSLKMLEFKDGKHTGRTIDADIIYMLEDYTGLTEGYCILGIRVTDYTGKVSETDTESGAEHE